MDYNLLDCGRAAHREPPNFFVCLCEAPGVTYNQTA